MPHFPQATSSLVKPILAHNCEASSPGRPAAAPRPGPPPPLLLSAPLPRPRPLPPPRRHELAGSHPPSSALPATAKVPPSFAPVTSSPPTRLCIHGAPTPRGTSSSHLPTRFIVPHLGPFHLQRCLLGRHYHVDSSLKNHLHLLFALFVLGKLRLLLPTPRCQIYYGGESLWRTKGWAGRGLSCKWKQFKKIRMSRRCS